MVGQKLNRAESTQTHAYQIDTVGVHIILLRHPVKDVQDFVGIPRAAGVLRGDDDGVNVAAHGDGVQRAVLADSVEIGTAQTRAVQEQYHRNLPPLLLVGVRHGNPEVVAVLHDIVMRDEGVVGLSRCREATAGYDQCL